VRRRTIADQFQTETIPTIVETKTRSTVRADPGSWRRNACLAISCPVDVGINVEVADVREPRVFYYRWLLDAKIDAETGTDILAVRRSPTRGRFVQ